MIDFKNARWKHEIRRNKTIGTDVTWRGGQNRLWISWFLIYEEVKLDGGGRIGLNQSLTDIHPSPRLSAQYMLICPSSTQFVCFWRDSPQWARASSFTRFLDHTQWGITVGRTPLDKWSARRRALYLTTHNTHKRKTSMPLVGFFWKRLFTLQQCIVIGNAINLLVWSVLVGVLLCVSVSVVSIVSLHYDTCLTSCTVPHQ